MISTVIYTLSGFLIGFLIARIFKPENDSEKDNIIYPDNHDVKYDGICERCNNPNGQKVILSRYNILCNRCEDKILGLD